MRIICFNDVGFIGGAGIALGRQVQSLLLDGHEVGVICWLENATISPLPIRGRDWTGQWLGLFAYPRLRADELPHEDALVHAIREKVLELSPDIILAGNLHWANWPLAALRAIQDAGVPVVAYLHDCHWLTGRCAYTGGCELFSTTGCDATCPTPEEYPSLDPILIASAHQAKREAFTGPFAIPLAANSRWTEGMVREAYGDAANVQLVHLGLDTDLYAPVEPSVAHRLLSLVGNRFRILIGAVDLGEARKGGILLRQVLQRLMAFDDIEVLAFGHNSEHIQGVRALGHVADPRMMPIIFSASDVFLNCAQDESFGQTVLEASACATPTVALRIGGLPDIVQSGQTGVLIDETDPDAIVEALINLKEDVAQRRSMARAARVAVSEYFSLDKQAERLVTYLQDVKKAQMAD